APGLRPPPRPPARPARDRGPALEGGRGLLALGELAQPHLDLAVHDERELVVGGGPPAAGALGADGLKDVLAVLADGDLLIGLRPRRHLEDVGEGVVLGVVVDDLDRTLLVVLQGAELGLEPPRHRATTLLSASRCMLALRHPRGVMLTALVRNAYKRALEAQALIGVSECQAVEPGPCGARKATSSSPWSEGWRSCACSRASTPPSPSARRPSWPASPGPRRAASCSRWSPSATSRATGDASPRRPSCCRSATPPSPPWISGRCPSRTRRSWPSGPASRARRRSSTGRRSSTWPGCHPSGGGGSAPAPGRGGPP